jgi:hypothetical protein
MLAFVQHLGKLRGMRCTLGFPGGFTGQTVFRCIVVWGNSSLFGSNLATSVLRDFCNAL